ncbi:MAG TPA: FkbM family methyltransferase [Pseudolabrys sp.]|nr:FkbM family methyltransferase [Pseudolabrys sp.]
MTAPLRRFLERVTRGAVFRRRLPADFAGAPLYVSPGAAGLAYLFKSMAAIDPMLLQCANLLVKPGDVLWDVGANVGLFTLAGAVRAGARGSVFAFEPDAWLVQLLRRTSALQRDAVAPITVIPAAVAGDVGFRSFSIARRSRASNALSEYGHGEMGGVGERQVVPTFNLDWLLERWPRPDLIKIDVEGAELEVLGGQSRLLHEVRPIFICEIGKDNAAAVGAIFTGARYRMYAADRLREAKALPQAAWNTVAIPEEKHERLGLN